VVAGNSEHQFLSKEMPKRVCSEWDALHENLLLKGAWASKAVELCFRSSATVINAGVWRTSRGGICGSPPGVRQRPRVDHAQDHRDQQAGTRWRALRLVAVYCKGWPGRQGSGRCRALPGCRAAGSRRNLAQLHRQ
jgi:hypothetical protein